MESRPNDRTETMTRADVLIWGASSRAASWSAARAGWRALAFDLFADVDFPTGVDVHQLQDLSPAAFQTARLDFIPSPPRRFLPTGGWENVCDQPMIISDEFTLLGCVGEAIRKSRDPFYWSQLLDGHQLPRLVLRGPDDFAPPQTNLSWLRKSRESVGGLGVREMAEPSPPPLGSYDQEKQTGLSCSAICLSQSGETAVLGMSLQLTRDCGPELPFLYAGNASPLERFTTVDLSGLKPLAGRYADVLGNGCELDGLWGFDFLWNNGQLWVTEINPRYTAAMELWELIEQRSLLSLIGSNSESSFGGERRRRDTGLVKQIAYAEDDFVLPDNWNWERWSGRCEADADALLWEPPSFSDLPRPGTAFRPGEPVCTIWAEGTDEAACGETLRNRLTELRRFFPVR